MTCLNLKHRSKSFIQFVLGILFLLNGTQTVFAQDDFEPSTSSPYHTIFTHLYYLQPETYQPEFAALAIDPEAVSDSLERIKRSIQLKQILDGAGLFVNLESLPRSMNFVDSTENKSVYTLFPDSKPQIYLLKRGEHWYYSPQTVNAIPEMHKELFPFGSGFLMNLFPEIGQDVYFGIAVWQYVGILIMLVLAGLFFWLAQKLIRPFVRRILRRWLSKSDDGLQIKYIDRLAMALSLLLILQVICYFLPMLLLPIRTAVVVTSFISIVQVFCIALVLMRLTDFFFYYLEKVVGHTDNKMDDQLLPMINKLVYLFIIAGAILQILSLLDVNVTALIAGVSIGGLAIALAAQDAVKNFIGSLMIFTDKPFQIGDYIVGSGFEGEVAEVGFRTTRIKAIDTSIIAVPNGSIANMNIENKGVRIMRLFNIVIGVTYDSKPEQLKAYIADLKQLIIEHPLVSSEIYYVHLKEMADSSINIMFRAYLNVPGYPDELKLKEEILYSIMELAEKNGLSFAFPSRSVYIHKDASEL